MPNLHPTLSPAAKPETLNHPRIQKVSSQFFPSEMEWSYLALPHLQPPDLVKAYTFRDLGVV